MSVTFADMPDLIRLLRSLQTPCSSRKRIVGVALVTVALAVSACGSDTNKTVATIGDMKVSQATLSHWMKVTLDMDYQTLIGARAPDALLPNPPNYARCVRAIVPIVPKTGGMPKLTTEQMRIKCHQLYAGI